MRQRRSSLQVSTFPFLAVLLCTMGSLILLLLVIDRRARVVAILKARQALEQSVAEDAREAEKRRAEWERRRQALHAQLQSQNEEIVAQLGTARKEETRIASAVHVEEGEIQELRKRLESQQSQLAGWEADLSTKRAEIARASRETTVSQTELARLSAELNRMEQALADLKALRRRQKETYSLVPYQGKRGDNRKPIYVECTPTSVIFHPDQRLLPFGPLFSPALLKEEIDKTLSARQGGTTAVSGAASDREYVLLLVRPGGITTYYRTTAILQALKIDFGYEFVDADWVLEFPDDPASPSKQPWTITESNNAWQIGKGAKRKVTGLRPNGVESLASGAANGSAANAAHRPQIGNEGPSLDAREHGQLGGIAGARGPSDGGARSSVEAQGATGATAASQGGRFGQTGTDRGGPARANSGPLDLSGAPAPHGDPSPMTALPMVNLGIPRVISAAGRRNEGSAETSGTPMARDPGATSMPGTDKGGYGPPAREASSVAGPRSGTGPSDSVRQGRAEPDTQNKAMLSESAALFPSLAPSQPAPQGKPESQANPESRGPAGSDSTVGQAANPSSRTPGEQPSEGGSADPRQAASSDPLAALAPKDAQKKTARSVGVRPAMLAGNRDWLIPIECAADGIVILTTRQRIPATLFTRRDSGDNALAQAVRQIIARRQATVRPGEPPYRPMIRFRVHADGLRTYYLAYPALGPLGVPMSREDFGPEEETRKNVSGYPTAEKP